MFPHHSPNHRAEPAPTAIELWAQCEAKSPTMAADLLSHSRQRSQRQTKRGRRYSALLVLAATLVLATYWLC
jgi:hypothetical protein